MSTEFGLCASGISCRKWSRHRGINCFFFSWLCRTKHNNYTHCHNGYTGQIQAILLKLIAIVRGKSPAYLPSWQMFDCFWVVVCHCCCRRCHKRHCRGVTRYWRDNSMLYSRKKNTSAVWCRCCSFCSRCWQSCRHGGRVGRRSFWQLPLVVIFWSPISWKHNGESA